MLIIGVLSFNITPISTFRGAIVREIQKCLPEAICLLQDLHCLQRFYHNIDHWDIKLYILQNFTFSRAFNLTRLYTILKSQFSFWV